MNRQLLQQSLDALSTPHHFGDCDALCAALREALAAPEPEPVMEFKGRRLTPEGTRECWGMLLCKPEQDPARGALLYAAPPAAPAPAAPVVPLTDGQIRQIVRDTFDVVPLPHDITFARAIEAAHGITGASK